MKTFCSSPFETLMREIISNQMKELYLDNHDTEICCLRIVLRKVKTQLLHEKVFLHCFDFELTVISKTKKVLNVDMEIRETKICRFRIVLRKVKTQLFT